MWAYLLFIFLAHLCHRLIHEINVIEETSDGFTLKSCILEVIIKKTQRDDESRPELLLVFQLRMLALNNNKNNNPRKKRSCSSNL